MNSRSKLSLGSCACEDPNSKLPASEDQALGQIPANGSMRAFTTGLPSLLQTATRCHGAPHG